MNRLEKIGWALTLAGFCFFVICIPFEFVYDSYLLKIPPFLMGIGLFLAGIGIIFKNRE